MHPGKGERRGRVTARGRQPSARALEEVAALLGDRPTPLDMLIEFLHLIQDRYRCLSADHLAALAERMRVPQALVYETATFYHHFDVLKEGEEAPPKLTVRVCESLTCEMFGAHRVFEALKGGLDPAEVRVLKAPCMGFCDRAPAVAVNHRHVSAKDHAAVVDAIEKGHHGPEIHPYPDLAAYRKEGGYGVLERCQKGDLTFEAVTEALNEAGLRGLGGAGFPTGRKWGLVKAQPAPRHVCVNADEGEPGTFKDRFYLNADPHRFLEGALIAAWAMEAENLWIYLRDEYPGIRQILGVEVEALENAGLVPAGYIRLRRGAGAYICGEESSMIESLEGKRGLPRNRPPYVAQKGLFGRPTLVNNVETLFWIPEILDKGARWFAERGTKGFKGMRSYSVSGRVKEPGVKMAPAGSTVTDLIEQCGGMLDGHGFKAYLPGGASGGILPASMGDLPLEFGELERHGSFVGSHAVVILSDQDDMKACVRNVMRFFEDESCGQCTPCRVGTEKAVKLLERDDWDEDLLMELSRAMTDASICGLGQAATNPLKSYFKFLKDL
ncbi:MAG: NAD(P)H-dependent oxidoreductase subunit E [Geminicoccaceae bacterium]|nr:NAD(P)H-dependent oxidoreductase subunit E [Geminicoccaceae bacterium]